MKLIFNKNISKLLLETRSKLDLSFSLNIWSNQTFGLKVHKEAFLR